MPNPFDKNKGSGITAAKRATPSTPPRIAAAPRAAAPRNGSPPKAKPEAGDGFDTTDADGSHVTGNAGDPFSTPPGVSEYKITELVGALMLVKPTEVIEQMDTDIGTAENVVRADVTVLEDAALIDPETQGPTGETLAAGSTVEDILIFQMALKRALLRVMDGPNPYLLGRLGMGNAKKGKNAPFIFERPDEDDAVLARQYLASVS
jgi:hypothetical protein